MIAYITTSDSWSARDMEPEASVSGCPRRNLALVTALLALLWPVQLRQCGLQAHEGFGL